MVTDNLTSMNMSALVEPETDISKELLRDLVIFSLFDLKSFPLQQGYQVGVEMYVLCFLEMKKMY